MKYSVIPTARKHAARNIYKQAFIAGGLFSALMLAGCMVGPDYHRPDISLPASWESAPATKAKEETEVEWWKQFHDPVLEQLIAKAAEHNLDLTIATARIGEARAATGAARSSLFPSLGASGGITREANQFAFPGTIPGLTKPFNIFQTGFDASWEADLFGGKRRELEAAKAELSASEISRDNVKVSLLAEVARTYVDIRHYQQQLAIVGDTMESEKHTVAIATERYKAGKAPHNDVSRAETQLQQAVAQLPFYENLLAQSEYSMDVLLADVPGTTHKLVKSGHIPSLPPTVFTLAPAAVMAARPDVQYAERQLAAATARQGVAQAERFPKLSLSGFFGLLNTQSGNLLSSDSKSWLGAGNVALPLLNYGAITADIETADSRQQIALATYQKSVISALSDVERSLTNYLKQDAYAQSLSAIAEQNRKISEVAQERYKEGLTSFTDVLDAKRNLYRSQSQAAEAQAATTNALISLYKSLGGGWKENAGKDDTA